MSVLAKTAAIALALLAFLSVADAQETGIVPPNAAPALKQVLDNFTSISKLSRGSGHEEAIRELLISTARVRALETRTDKAGNLLVNVPGTGRFSASARTVALQAHLDMVWDVDPAIAGGANMADFFKNGVELVAEDGWVHSKNHATSIGADDGLGVAIMLRYLMDKTIEHPALELIFTVNEELGLLGAERLDLPVSARTLISLDNGEFGKVAIGSAESQRTLFSYDVPVKTRVPDGYARFKLSLSGLKGGHSGGDIHLGRANAVQILAETLQASSRDIPELLLLKATVGTATILNKIPASFEALVAVPAKDEGALRGGLARLEKTFQARFSSSEDAQRMKLALEPLAAAGPDHGLDAGRIGALSAVLLRLPNGILKEGKECRHCIEVSSNLGFFSLEEKKEFFSAEYGIMARGSVAASLVEWIGKTADIARGAPFPMKIAILSHPPAWTPNRSSALLKKYIEFASKKYGAFEPEVGLGGLETAYFAIKFPKMDMIAIASTIKNMHSRNESFELASLAKHVDLLDEFLKND